LTGVQRATGAQIELPPGAANERVVIDMGPAPARDVISDLLTGAKWNYVIIGNEQQDDSIARVIVTQRQPDAGGGNGGGFPARNAAYNAPAVLRPANPSGDEEDAQSNQQPQPQGMPGQQPGAQAAPGNIPSPLGPTTPTSPAPVPQFPTTMPGMQPADQQQPQNPNPMKPQPQVKTPEQLLEELKRLQQQQQQNPPPQNPPHPQ